MVKINCVLITDSNDIEFYATDDVFLLKSVMMGNMKIVGIDIYKKEENVITIIFERHFHVMFSSFRINEEVVIIDEDGEVLIVTENKSKEVNYDEYDIN